MLQLLFDCFLTLSKLMGYFKSASNVQKPIPKLGLIISFSKTHPCKIFQEATCQILIAYLSLYSHATENACPWSLLFFL